MRDCPTGKEHGFENILDPITSDIFPKKNFDPSKAPKIRIR